MKRAAATALLFFFPFPPHLRAETAGARCIDCAGGGRQPDSGRAKRLEPARAAGTWHAGFRIDPIPGDWLIPLAAQRPDRAFRGTAFSSRRHSMVGDVRISPPAPEPLRMNLLKQAIERKMKRQESERIRDFRFELSEGVRNGVPTLEIRTECTDAGTNPPSKMITRGFVVVTADNRMLAVNVSERSADPDFRFNTEEAEIFFRAVLWEGERTPPAPPPDRGSQSP